ncbi:LysE family translocator [Oceanicella sp. SM1341]|uniref:LysE family translocator n=1 Tax=Oceanicella sp. SM1341 TaxID=1548889 RepID=UPI000E53A724|nr:LysE family translocator [Oceanicella sp. SM1341]
MTPEQILAFLPAAFLLGISPGANNLLAFTSAATAGWRRAAGGVLGRLAAWAVLVVLVSLGLDTLLRASEAAFVALKWLGVAFLAFLAWRFWQAEDARPPELPGTAALARREFLTLLGNPKAYLLLTAVLPQFLGDEAPARAQLILLGGLYLVTEGLAATLWAAAGALLGAHALTPLRRRLLNRASAGLMACAAVLLARSGRAAPA